MIIIAGSCSVENEKQIISLAEKLKERKIEYIRASLFKPRTDPKAYQGIGYNGLYLLEMLRDMGMKPVCEVLSIEQAEKVKPYVSMFQVGTRNMYNYELLKFLGTLDKPVLLKRAFSGYVNEWLKSKEYITQMGNENVILCERGIRSFDNITRNVLDIGAIIYLKQNTNNIVIADPSHSMGNSDFIIPASKAAMAAGADGLIVEVHENPKLSKSDNFQTIDLIQFDHLLEEIGWNK